eukprot:1675457-Amphidinium_carterae.1
MSRCAHQDGSLAGDNVTTIFEDLRFDVRCKHCEWVAAVGCTLYKTTSSLVAAQLDGLLLS